MGSAMTDAVRAALGPKLGGAVARSLGPMKYWLFDIDGTLVDSTPAVERAWRTWAAENGFDGDEILAVSHGRRSEDTLADLLAPELVAPAYRRVFELEMGDLESVVALPGAAGVLASLPRDRWAAWLNPQVPADNVLVALPKGSLDVVRVFPPAPAQAALL